MIPLHVQNVGVGGSSHIKANHVRDGDVSSDIEAKPKGKKKQIQGNGIVSVATPIAFSQTRLREGQEGGGGDVGDSDMTTAEGYG